MKSQSPEDCLGQEEVVVTVRENKKNYKVSPKAERNILKIPLGEAVIVGPFQSKR